MGPLGSALIPTISALGCKNLARVYICMGVYMYIYIFYLCRYVRRNACVYVCMNVCMYVCMCFIMGCVCVQIFL